MKRGMYVLLIVAAFVPVISHAYTVQSVSVSSSDTGGISAGSGETVVTGSSGASSEIRTFVTGGSGGGTVDVRISTERDGVRQTETRRYDIPRGGSVVIEVATTSPGRAAAATSSIRGSTRAGDIRVSSGTPQASSSTDIMKSVASTTPFSWLSGLSDFLSFLFGRVFFIFPSRSNEQNDTLGI